MKSRHPAKPVRRALKFAVVEDDEQIADGLRRALQSDGDQVEVFGLYADAERALKSASYDLIILDLGLPDGDGTLLLTGLRRREVQTPVVVLTARDGLSDRVETLDLGADDYMVKPFELSELQARIRAVIRRAHAQSAGSLALSDLRLDLNKRRAYIGENPVVLSPRELKLLEALLLKRGQVVSKAQIHEHLCDWSEELSDGAIELYIHRVRRKIETAGVEIRTVRGFGYLLQSLDGSS